MGFVFCSSDCFSLLFLLQYYPVFDDSNFSMHFIIFTAFIFQENFKIIFVEEKKACEVNLEDIAF